MICMLLDQLHDQCLARKTAGVVWELTYCLSPEPTLAREAQLLQASRGNQAPENNGPHGWRVRVGGGGGEGEGGKGGGLTYVVSSCLTLRQPQMCAVPLLS